ncbi:MAG: M48 family metalloprotease [Candidatus Orphnella occulta]|nr:M48 family metalloprotease [Candidatus Orphnella occulta]MDP8296673.1 M48 family metalloprotease [Candidatus Orphnella occulta]
MENTTIRAKAYSAGKRKIAVCEWALTIAFFAALLFSGGSRLLISLALMVSQNPYIIATIYIVIAGSLLQIILLPLDYTASFKMEHDFGLSRQTISSWLIDFIKKFFFTGLLYLVMILTLYLFLRISPVFWWLYSGIAYFFMSVILAKIFPQIVIPLFYKLTIITDELLKDRLNRLAGRMDVEIVDVYKIGLGAKTSKANAAVCGIGKSKRILLSDTLLENYTPDEIEATLAHELAHHKHRHFWKLSTLNFLSILLNLLIIKFILDFALSAEIISAQYSIEAFPVIAIVFTLYGICALPILNLVSRKYETQADKDAIAIAGKPFVFASLIEKLTLQNLSDPSPGVIAKNLFYDHPPASERISSIKSQ